MSAQGTAGENVMVQGRIVWTSGKTPFEGKAKVDQNTRQPRFDKNNQPMVEYGFGLAVPKTSLSNEPGNIWTAMHSQAKQMFPNSPQIPPNFAMKFKDGDKDVDQNGVPYSQREGYAGHIVLACTTTIPVKFFRHENGHNIPINDGIKCGDYVMVQLNVKAHPAHGQGKPGLYLNPNACLFVGYGTAIVNTPTGNDIFGTQAPALPQGASATPVAQPGMAPLVPTGIPQQAPQAFQTPMVAQVPNGLAPQGVVPVFGGVLAATPMQPQAPAPIQPHYGILPQAHQPQVQPMSVPGPMTQPPVTQAPVNGFAPQAPAQFGGFPNQQPGGFPPPFPGAQ